MSANTKIEWADHTFNPWIGCTKVSPGCDHCYAKAEWEDRRHRVVWGAGQRRSLTQTWGDPVRWNKQHDAFYAQHGRRQRVFCASLADVFDNEVPPEWRQDLFELIAGTPNLDWLLLTKRIGNAHQMIGKALIGLAVAQGKGPTDLLPSWPLPNVWIGATIVNQEEADRDIPKLLAAPAAKRFLSMEPLLGPVDLQKACTACCPNRDCEPHHSGRRVVRDSENGGTYVECICSRLNGIHWVIVGGESGPHARPMHPDWARRLRDQCQAVGVPFLFKQWGEWIEASQSECPNGPPLSRWLWGDGQPFKSGDQSEGRALFCKAGKKAAGRLLDGRTWDEMPA